MIEPAVVKKKTPCYATSQLSHFATSKLSHGGGCLLELVLGNILISFLSEGLPRYDVSPRIR
jgi:hypothetical protein